MTAVGDNQSLLSSLKDSPYYKMFQDETSVWEYRLTVLDEGLHKLNNTQRRWVYLEPIFSRGALPQEQPRFNKVDSEFRAIMAHISSEKRVISLVDYANIREVLIMLLDQLERCQKALTEYLEEKRAAFPRFYFLGDDDLLEILGQAQNPLVIQSHLKKLFQGIHSVEFSENKKQITAMKSSAGEFVKFQSPVAITEKVEDWLSRLAAEMRNTLKNLLVQCVEVNDIVAFPSQILCAAEMIHFTQKCEVAIQKGGLKQLHKELQDTLSKYTSFDTADGITRLKLKALVLDIIHNMDVVEQLLKENVTSVNSWPWQKQLRFYLDERRNCKMRMSDAEFDYTYEYQGNAPKLVHTPLTDKCYLTLTQAMLHGFGGNPYGPAGTGKTESVKALGQAFARQVLVFNCDEGIDFKSMGRIFTGIVKCGAWGCFDEFNRLDEEVLSAVSQQIQVIQTALKTKERTLTLLGNTIDVDFNSGIFVTLNPAGKGYGGRSKLPDNLKQLFRGVAMAIPDLEQISEVILYSEGFMTAKDLGAKLVCIFNLSKQLLTPQQHYDWGLRALKTILGTGGQLLQTEKKVKKTIDAETESRILVQALRINTLSKLTFDDTKRFNALVEDVFPNLNVQDASAEDLDKEIKNAFAEFKLDVLPTQVRKILQFNEACNQRMGVVIVGPGGSGKSTLWKVLQAAMVRLRRKIITYTINPKSIPRQQLLGYMDLDTREWFDGVLTAAARSVVKEPLEIKSWIICDGDIDPEWVESLNSVLDDNRLLTLPSGERIQFASNVNFIFETHSLKWASPATVSRMGMIFLADEDMDSTAVIHSWTKQQPADYQQKIVPLIDQYFAKGLEWILKDASYGVETTKAGTVLNGLSQLKGISTKSEFALGLIRGLGSNLDLEKRANFAREVFTWTNENPIDRRRPLNCYYDVKAMAYRSYDGDVVMNISSEELLKEPVVPTVDVRSNADVIIPWIRNGDPFIVVGPEGCGKHMTLRHCFQQVPGTSVATIHCSSQTNAQQVIQKLNQHCGIFSSVKGRVYRPKEGERLIIYLKDLNLPRPDKYETIQLIAFLQQLITYGGFYDEKLEWLGLERVQIVGSMNPPTTTGRHVLTTRFTALMRLLVINYPAREQLQSIYSVYVDAALLPLSQHAQWRQKPNRQKLASTMVEVYDQVKAKFTVDDFAHYQFTPRDITKWVVGLLRYDLQNSDLFEVWTYEGDRHFKDRLVDSASKQRFERIVESIVKTQWNITVNLKDFFFTSWLNANPNEKKDSKTLKKIPSAQLKEITERALVLYEREFRELRLQLFPEVIEHIARLDRILSSPEGAVLLVGKSGVGRRSSVTLASFASNIKLFSPNISRDYSLKNFKVDLKAVMQVAGVEGEQCVLLLEDHQFVLPEFMELINSLLSSGEIPGLYSPEEIEPLLSPLKDKLSEQGYFGSLFGFFVKRVRDNLKIVISMDPANDQFQSRCESNPALFTKCNIQWWNTWSPETLKYVATTSLPKDIPNPEVVVKGILHIQESMQVIGATPRQYVTLLENYKNIYQTKRKAALEQQNRLQMGLGKLNEAASVVDQLSQDASVKKLKLAEKQEQANHALQEITKSMEMASEQRKEMKTLEEKLEHEKVKMEDRKKEIESKLAGIQPKLDRAKELVGQIKPESLTEIKTFSTPPAAVAVVLSGVLTLMGNHDTSWNSMKRFLSERGVKDQILHFDAHLVSPESRAAVKKILDEKGASFEESAIQKTSKAAAPLAAWVKANVEYSEVLDSVMPLEENLAKLKKNLETSEKRMKKLKDGLIEVDQKVNKLTNEFQGRTAEAAALKLELDKAEQMLDAAQMLLSKLGGEKGRWDQQVSDISKSLETLPANVLLAAGFITFLPSHPEDFRRQMITDWAAFTSLPTSWNFKQFMSTESELLVLKGEGLPADELSMENSVCILQGIDTPFIIDPTTIVRDWLKEHMKSKSVQFTTQEDQRFSNTLELAIRFGKTLVVQEVDKLHPVLYPVIRRDKIRNGSRFQVQVGEKSVEYNEEFRLFLITRNSSPVIPPDAQSLISTINFTTTRSGLEGQLLGITIKHEKPELEQRKSQMLLEEEKQKVQLAALETQLLQELAASQGNILENKTLIESLNETKSKSTIIAQSLKEARELQENLDKERNVYKKVAVHGSLLFFLISDLQKINRMYQYSLGSFLKLFNAALQKSEKDVSSTAVEARINTVCDRLQRLVFEYVSRSLFKADRLMFGLHLVHTMYPKLFGENEWEIFTQKILAPIGGGNTTEFPSWATSDRKSAFSVLQNTIPRVVQALTLKDMESWTPWAKSPVCELEFPTKYAKKVTAFQKILLIQALRPDRLESALNQFVCEATQVQSLSPAALNLFKVYKDESVPTEPILLIVSPGADPSQELEEVALKVVGREKYLQVAMGQGQAEVALASLRKAATEGGWLCLKNLHLAISWMGTLEKELHSMTPHPDFRLWLTSEPHLRFSSILLKSSLKITFEAPPGLKKNLLRTYESWNSEFISKGSILRANALFTLAWFHAIIQERRTFIPQGWTKFYEFSFTDLRSSADIIEQVTGGNIQQVEWTVVHGILENAIYGGRVDNDYDVRVLKGYLQYYFNNEMLGKQATKKFSKTFNLPNSVQHEAYMDIITQLPDADNPTLFFLPSNIDRSLQRANSQMVISQLKILSTSVDINSKFNREKWAQELTPMIQLWQNLTANNSSLNDPKTDNNPDLSPIDSFVAMETKKAHDLLKSVNATIQSLVKVINGTQLLTPAIVLVGGALLKGEVPARWGDAWEGASDPYLWLKGVVSRTIALDNWTEKSRNQTLLTNPVDLGDLFRPETFINALRQQTARLIKCPVQQLKLIASPEIRQMVRCKLPVTVTGLLLQGAGFEGGRLSELNSDSPAFTNIQQLVIGFVPQQEPDPYPLQNLVSTPLYYTSSKEKLLYEIALPCSNDKPKWILTGVSLSVCE